MTKLIRYWMNFLFIITKQEKYRYYKNYYKRKYNKYNNNIIIIKDINDEEKKLPPYTYIPYLNIEWNGNNNTIIIEEPTYTNSINISFQGDNNTFSIGAYAKGFLNLTAFGNDNKITFGRRVECANMCISLHDKDSLSIGNNCMISELLFCMTDGHSVVDANTRELLNIPPYHIEIGNHVWIGRNVTILKGVTIPSNCIVGMNSTVTKRFNEENCVIAGNPAKIVKRNINWNGERPSRYNKNNVNIEF